MNSKVNAQTANERVVIGSFEKQFAPLHTRYCSLIQATPLEILYRKPRPSSARPLYSVGENVLRGAGSIEQTFGGITANLWDDPFEWTLPENLSTAANVIEYLGEVEATRQRAFACFARDADLLKEILTPGNAMRPLIDLLTETLVKASDYYGRATATLSLLSDLAVSQCWKGRQARDPGTPTK